MLCHRTTSTKSFMHCAIQLCTLRCLVQEINESLLSPQWSMLLKRLLETTITSRHSCPRCCIVLTSCDIRNPSVIARRDRCYEWLYWGKQNLFSWYFSLYRAALPASLVDLLSLLIRIHYFRCNKMHWPAVLLSFTGKRAEERTYFLGLFLSLSLSLCLISLLIKKINAKSQQHPVPCWFWLLWHQRKRISEFDLLIFVDHG